MQQPCSRCGYISDRPARFCRQCGSPMFDETESSSAATRNYIPQQAQPQYGGQPGSYPSYGQGQPFDDQTPNTTPFYRPPLAPHYQVPPLEQKSSNFKKWVLIGLLAFLLVTGIAVVGGIYLGRQWIQREAGNLREARGSDVPLPQQPPEPPDAPGAPPRQTASGSLDAYKYPGATVTESHKAGLNEVIKMTTEDDFDTVKEYYNEKFKNSSISIKNEDGQKLIFTTTGQPLITIIVQPSDADEDKTEINLLRVNIPLPHGVLPDVKFR